MTRPTKAMLKAQKEEYLPGEVELLQTHGWIKLCARLWSKGECYVEQGVDFWAWRVTIVRDRQRETEFNDLHAALMFAEMEIANGR